MKLIFLLSIFGLACNHNSSPSAQECVELMGKKCIIGESGNLYIDDKNNWTFDLENLPKEYRAGLVTCVKDKIACEGWSGPTNFVKRKINYFYYE
jgi:hypothetical protein